MELLQKTKVDLVKLINDSSDKLRNEVKVELEECREKTEKQSEAN
jgi:hypothetical protein